MMKTFVPTAVTALSALGCAHRKTNSYTSYQKTEQMAENQDKYYEVINEEEPQSRTYIYFTGDCFWGTEHFFKQTRNVLATEMGYANGNRDKAPTYKQTCGGNTSFAETVGVIYNPQLIDPHKLTNLYLKIIDPALLNEQGNDRSTQYRTSIYYTDTTGKPLIEKAVHQLTTQYTEPVAVEVLPLHNLYRAGEYHQAYLGKNPNGYCHISPTMFELAHRANPVPTRYKRPAESKSYKLLIPEQYAVTQESTTECPFANEYWSEYREGIYVDITTDEPLFISTDKFESGCGRPSLSEPINKKLVTEKADTSHQVIRTEVRNTLGSAHLGHVFNDGPKGSGDLRYCINSASLHFIPKEDMEEEGYGEYLGLLEER